MSEEQQPILIPETIYFGDKDERLQRKMAQARKELKKSLDTLHASASQANEAYTAEIEDGTKKKQLLIEAGSYGRNQDDERSALDVFVPANDTPILNFLYFSERDGKYEKNITFNRRAEDVGEVDILRTQLDEEFGKAFDSYELSQTQSDEFVKSEFKNEIRDFESFLYSKGDYDTFKKLKKLKNLAKSSDSHEAKLAEERCRQLCTKYKIDFDRIPAL